MEYTDNEYIEAFAQLKTIINMMPEELKSKIPQDIIEVFDKYTATNVRFKYDYSKSIDEQPISDLTRDVLADIYIEYLCDENEKKGYEAIIQDNINNIKMIYEDSNLGSDDIFKKNKERIMQSRIEREKSKQEETALVEAKEEKKESILTRFINIIKNLFINK